MRWQHDTGDTIVHYARASRTFTERKRLKAAKEFKSNGLGFSEFQSGIYLIRGNNLRQRVLE